jgi:hypothetical protein
MKVTLILLLIMLFLLGCGKGPSTEPEIQVGSLLITTYLDTSSVDSMIVNVDGANLGIQSNPYLLDNLIAGQHLVSVAKSDPYSPIDYSSIPKEVLISHHQTTDVSFSLTKFAPIFTLNNLNDEQVALDDYRDQVILLIFFTHT